MNQRKCAKCGTWNATNQLNCSKCDQLIDPKELASAEFETKKKELEVIRLSKETRLEKWFIKFKHSESPFHRIIYLIGSTILTIYMAFMSFFIWLIALISG